MNIILFFIFLAFFLGNKSDKKKSDLFKGLLTFAIITALIGSITPIFWIVAIGLIIFVASQKNSDKSKSDKAEFERRKSEWERQRNLKKTADPSTSKEEYERRRREWEQQHGATRSTKSARTTFDSMQGQTSSQTAKSRGGTGTTSGQTGAKTGEKSRAGRKAYIPGVYDQSYTASRILPKPLMRRNRIITSFNQKYDLSLTGEEIRRIAEASYVSDSWKREVEAMTYKYETEGQWFAGSTDWLRVYIYAFQIQNISTDFSMQEQICFETLDEVMSYACEIPDATVEERVRRINDRYFTRFNEMSFMIAYRFLQRKGRNYELSRPDLVKNVDQELEEVMKKYQNVKVGAK